MFNKWLAVCGITIFLTLTSCSTSEMNNSRSKHSLQQKAAALLVASNRASGQRQLWQANRSGDKLSPFPLPGNTNTGNADIGNLVSFGEFAIFTAYHPEYGRELWRTDGTAKGTYLLKDTLPGPASGMNDSGYYSADRRNPLISVKTERGEVFFWSSTTKQITLWKTDGTTKGTLALKDFPRSTDTAKPKNDMIPRLIVLGERVFFQANDGQHGAELWHSDGTETGTKLLLDASREVPDKNGFAPSPGPLRHSNFQLTEKHLYFTTKNPVHHDHRQPSTTTLWRVARNTNEAVKVKQLSSHSTQHTALLHIDDENAYYYRSIANSQQVELWLLEIKSGKTRRIGLIGRKNQAFGGGLNDPVMANNFLYFKNTSMDSIEIWRTDGVKTQHLFTGRYDEKNYFSRQYAFADQVFFAAGDPYDSPQRHLFVWRSDSKSQKAKPTAIPLDQKKATSYSLNQYFFSEVNDHLLFAVPDEKTDSLVVYAISKEEPQQASVIGHFDSFIPIEPLLGQQNAELLFINGNEIWQTNGKPTGTQKITSFVHPQRNWQLNGYWDMSLYSSIGATIPVKLSNGKLLFSLDDRRFGTELWLSDGTAQGTKLVKDINTAPTRPEISDLVQTSDGWYFISESRLWFSDGSQANTNVIRGIPEHQTPHAALVTTSTGQYAYILTRQKANLPRDHRIYTLWRLDKGQALKLKVFNSHANILSGESALYIRQALNTTDKGVKQYHHAVWKLSDTAREPTLILRTPAKPFQYYPYLSGMTENGFLYSMPSSPTGTPDNFLFDETTRTSTQLDASANSQYFNTGQRLLRLTAPPSHISQSASIAEFDAQKLTFNTLATLPNLGEFHAVPTEKGLFISVFKHEQPKLVWYLGDDQKQLRQVKQFPPEQSVRLSFTKPHLYLNVANNQNMLSLTHEFDQVWISDGTPTGTRKVADSMQID